MNFQGTGFCCNMSLGKITPYVYPTSFVLSSCISVSSTYLSAFQMTQLTSVRWCLFSFPPQWNKCPALFSLLLCIYTRRDKTKRMCFAVGVADGEGFVVICGAWGNSLQNLMLVSEKVWCLLSRWTVLLLQKASLHSLWFPSQKPRQSFKCSFLWKVLWRKNCFQCSLKTKMKALIPYETWIGSIGKVFMYSH